MERNVGIILIALIIGGAFLLWYATKGTNLTSSPAVAPTQIIVYGGTGALGQAIVKHFKSKGVYVISIALSETPGANMSIIVPRDGTAAQQESAALQALASTKKSDALYCVAGGFAGGNAAAENFVKVTDSMVNQSLYTSAIAASIAAKHVKPEGLLVLSGSQTALNPSVGAIGYSISKQAVHHLTRSLGLPNSGVACTTLAILPVTLDTEGNRKANPGADTSTWTPLQYVVDLLEEWTRGSRPQNGSLVQIFTKQGKSKLVPI